MLKPILFATTLLIAGIHASAQKSSATKSDKGKGEVKFLDEISIDMAPSTTSTSDPKAVFAKPVFTSKKSASIPAVANNPAPSGIELAGGLHFKYALLLDTEVEAVTNTSLFREIDGWYGTRYRLGGNSKDGVDCSALMQSLFSAVYGLEIPRTAAEQYNFATHISRNDLKEGDLVFFNTVGGVSHVGMYLQNNKFVHASSSGGVMISDLYEDYWMRRFVGVGRVEKTAVPTAELNSQP